MGQGFRAVTPLREKPLIVPKLALAVPQILYLTRQALKFWGRKIEKPISSQISKEKQIFLLLLSIYSILFGHKNPTQFFNIKLIFCCIDIELRIASNSQ